MRKKYQQIDVIKGFAIISVVVLHSLQRETLLDIYAAFHIWQAVPLFMVLMGLNLGFSTFSKNKSLSGLYSKTYFLKKFSRIIVPLLLIYAISTVAGLVAFWLTGQNPLTFRIFNIIGMLPTPGPGNYFITLLLQSILLLPLLMFCYQRKPNLTLVLLVVLEVVFQLLCTHSSLFDKYHYLYDAALPRYFTALAFGLALSCAVTAPVSAGRFVPLLAVAAAGCVFLYQLLYHQTEIPFIRPEWQMQQVLTFAYAALLVLVLFRLLPDHSDNRLLKFPALLGKASYHIFLIQTVYFGIITVENDVPQDLIICLALGYLFFRYEGQLKVHRMIEHRQRS